MQARVGASKLQEKDMWQNILVFAILALAGGLTFWRFYQKFTGKSSCCGGGCSCKGSCGSGGSESSACSGGKQDSGTHLRPLSGGGCACSR